MKPIGLYIHFPFCKSKCPYCDFYSCRGTDDAFDEYTDAVIGRLREYSEYCFDTVYFGGGTPSILGADRLSQIAQAITEKNPDIAEFTVECNPSSIHDGFFEILKNAGVNRISMGLQSAADRERRSLGRASKAHDVLHHMDECRKSGIDNISLDLMLGIPHQDFASLKESVDFCAESGATHISAYLLKIEENTPFYKRRDKLLLPDEDECCELYLEAVRLLEKNGFGQYEISNFAKDKRVSRHNLKYWNCEEYLGIGPSAHSFMGGERFYFERSTKDFIGGASPVSDGTGGDFEEYAMLRLRLCEGLTQKGTVERFSRPIPQKMYENAKQIPQKHLSCSESGISLTPEGFLLSNQIICELLRNI